MSPPLDSAKPKEAQGGKTVSFFSLASPVYGDVGRPEVSDLSISATNRPNRTRVSSHTECRASLITSDGQKATSLLLRVRSHREHLKIRVLYYLTAFVRTWRGVRTYGDRKVLDRSFQHEVFGKGKRQTSRLIKCLKEMNTRS